MTVERKRRMSFLNVVPENEEMREEWSMEETRESAPGVWSNNRAH